MRVQLISKVDPQMTGLRRYQDTMADQLARAGCSVQTIYPPEPLPRLLLKSTRILGWDLETFFHNYPLWGKYPKADVYHLANESLASLLLFNRLKPSIVTVHGLMTYLLKKKKQRNLYQNAIHQFFDALAVRGLRKAQKIITVSHFLKQELINHTGIPDGNIRVIHEAVDHQVFRTKTIDDEFRNKHGLLNKYRYILYVGSEQPNKNFLLLIKAFARIHNRFTNVKLLKIGQPEFQTERKKALRLIEELGIKDKVIFLGHIGEELPLFYNVSEIFVYPSSFEGFGLPPLEAMACGVPVICSNAGALPEVTGSAAASIDRIDIDSLAEMMEKLLDDKPLREEYISRGMENANRFSWDQTAKKTLEVYCQVIHNS